jgi:mRNA interferase MazF
MNIFLKWSFIKNLIHENRTNKRYHAGDIWWCNLGKNIGFEQNGTGKNFERPVLVIKGFSKQVCLIAPLTTNKKINKFHFKINVINNKEATAILSQIRLIDTKRFQNKIGYINSKKLFQIKKAIWKLIR